MIVFICNRLRNARFSKKIASGEDRFKLEFNGALF